MGEKLAGFLYFSFFQILPFFVFCLTVSTVASFFMGFNVSTWTIVKIIVGSFVAIYGVILLVVLILGGIDFLIEKAKKKGKRRGNL